VHKAAVLLSIVHAYMQLASEIKDTTNELLRLVSNFRFVDVVDALDKFRQDSAVPPG